MVLPAILPLPRTAEHIAIPDAALCQPILADIKITTVAGSKRQLAG